MGPAATKEARNSVATSDLSNCMIAVGFSSELVDDVVGNDYAVYLGLDN
jgi:hypothetical protein